MSKSQYPTKSQIKMNKFGNWDFGFSLALGFGNWEFRGFLYQDSIDCLKKQKNTFCRVLLVITWYGNQGVRRPKYIIKWLNALMFGMYQHVRKYFSLGDRHQILLYRACILHTCLLFALSDFIWDKLLLPVSGFLPFCKELFIFIFLLYKIKIFVFCF